MMKVLEFKLGEKGENRYSVLLSKTYYVMFVLFFVLTVLVIREEQTLSYVSAAGIGAMALFHSFYLDTKYRGRRDEK